MRSSRPGRDSRLAWSTTVRRAGFSRTDTTSSRDCATVRSPPTRIVAATKQTHRSCRVTVCNPCPVWTSCRALLLDPGLLPARFAGDIVARLFGLAADPGQIHAHQTSTLLHHAAADEHRVHVARVHREHRRA